MILHGLWGASDNWLKVAKLCTDKFYVILPDLRNHGNSPHDSKHNYNVMADDIRELTERLALSQKPFIAGHSMGGKVLMHLLLKTPGIAEKAAVLDISPQDYPVSSIHRKLLEFILATPLSGFHHRMEVHKYIRQAFSSEECYQILLKNIRKTSFGFEWKVNAIALHDNLQELSAWSLPTTQYYAPILFVRGENSDYIRSTNPIHLNFPAAKLMVIPQASHRVHVDNPTFLVQTLSNFFLEK